METLITSVILILLVGLAVMYIWKEKKKGNRCIGCPSGGNCRFCSGCKTDSTEENAPTCR